VARGNESGAPLRRADGERHESDFDPPSDSALELIDVPAAVVCALCGDPDCAGCGHEDEPTQTSGIVAIVPWERPGPAPGRLWTTAKLSTLSADSFFAALPDGELAAPLRFAVWCELLAVLGMGVVAIPLVLAFAPWLFEAIGRDAWLRSVLAKALGVGVPGLALLMVVLHSAHGFGLDMGARRVGAKARLARGLRFGLYSCGWDLVTLPAGIGLLAITDGFGAARKAAPLSLLVPQRATLAFLRGVYQLDAENSTRAARRAWLFSGPLAALACLAFGVALALAFVL